MIKRLLLAAATVATAWAGIGAASAATLDNVRQRGQLICGVSQGFAGFSTADSRGETRGFDADYCRAVAAAVLGDASKVRFVALTAQNRFTALQAGEIDVLFRNSTQTFLRGNSIGLRQLPVNFYDGQGFATRRDAGVARVQDLNGATICVAQGTTHELNLADIARARNIRFQPVVFERVDTMYSAFFAGRCDAMTQDASALAGAISVAPNPAQFMVLSETISKEPLGPFVRNGDDQWANIVTSVHYALVEAEETGVTQANAQQQAAGSTDATVQRLLGRTGEFGSRIGLDNAWALNMIRAVGNYGELFERNLGQGSPLKLARGLNGLWSQGGLQYAIPFR
ncbi:amino acid ABC transporter substrate-binding protein [Roseococcus sp. SYP-B2431]|uniref:amino acid ABC transporter substrate-binding protein n=1 Tax=Roseococcus sp. SYP-B2431 TaxID=2496640 RepID=UPI00103C34AE|nr:amino acid ABC transporter substrate-binding protein [Roseococcus sp. SYP-B2431]TCH99722.1 amino acid ABC transporter substrate-binding protein [Roseococcus sp. SYP-B2431]